MVEKNTCFILVISFILFQCKLYSQGCCCSAEEKSEIKTFDQYKKCFKHSFHPDDEEKRNKIFKENLQTIKSLSSSHPDVKFGVNKFTHMSKEEFMKKYLGYKPLQDHNPTNKMGKGTFKTVDWREKGVVGKVKNQKRCGSCYAFSGVGVVESAYAIKKGQRISLSEQQVVDCSEEYGNNGCNGGLMTNVFRYLIDYGSLVESEYLYIGKEDNCTYNESRALKLVTDYKEIMSGSEEDLTSAIQNIGPIAVAIDASPSAFMFYESGIFSSPDCSSIRLNHAVIAVGVSAEYYIVRNSWGSSWGDGGYVKMARNRNNMCGIATAASYPVLG